MSAPVQRSLNLVVPVQPVPMPLAARDSTERVYGQDWRHFDAYVRARSGAETVPLPPDPRWFEAYVADQVAGLDESLVERMAALGVRTRQPKPSVRTIRRRLNSISVVLTIKGHPVPVSGRTINLMLRRYRQAEAVQRRPHRAITADVLEHLVATCDDAPRGRRDRAILLVGFALGGRRRSELASLQAADVTPMESGYWVRLATSKTDTWSDGEIFRLEGKAADALADWLAVAPRSGVLFRSIHRSGRMGKGITAEAIYQMVKKRAKRAGYDPAEFGAHSLRSGFMTEAAKQGMALPVAMEQSGHRSVAVASRYYRMALYQNAGVQL